jgi:hypothetical protein
MPLHSCPTARETRAAAAELGRADARGKRLGAAAAAEGHENESLQKDEDYSKTQYIIQKQHKTHM